MSSLRQVSPEPAAPSFAALREWLRLATTAAHDHDPTRAALAGLLFLGVVLVGCDQRHPADDPASVTASSPGVGRDEVPPADVMPTGPASPAAPREITFDDIKLDLEKGAPFRPEVLTDRVRSIDGRRVRIRGYILPSFQQSGLTQFVLVRDNQECCFGPGAALHDCIVVRMQSGRTADFSIRPVAVAGTFRVAELRGPDGGHLAIYALEGENVQ